MAVNLENNYGLPEGFKLDDDVQGTKEKSPKDNYGLPEGFQLDENLEPKEHLGRAAAQTVLGALESTKRGIGLSLLNMFGTGEALAELDELEERLPQLRKEFPDMGIPEHIDREKYLQAVKDASESFPTVANLSSGIEHMTGIPLTPKTALDRKIRFMSQIAGFKPGAVPEKIMSGLKGQIATELLQHAGVPKDAAEGLGLYYGLREVTPKINVTKEVAKESEKIAEQTAEKLPSELSPAPAKEEIERLPSGLSKPTASITSPISKIAPGTVIPETKGAFEQKENILKQLATPNEKPPIGLEVAVSNTKANAPSLQGRVSEAKELGEAISKEPFETEAQAGRAIAKDVTTARNGEREIVRDKYKKAEEVTQSHNAIFPELAKQNDERIGRLESLEKRSTGEEAVYQDALSLRRMIGTTDGLIENNADRLMKQANSFSQKVKYELPYAGYKGEIKSIVHEINQSVISSLKNAGKDAAAVIDADKTFSRFADRFMGDEISPYFQKKILDPEKLGVKAISDAATYRAVKAAVGSRTTPLVNKIDREVVHTSMDKYYQKPSLVNSKEYVKDLKALAEKIGKEKTAEVDYFLRKKQLNAERNDFLKNKIEEAQLTRKALKSKENPSALPKNEPIAKTPEELDKLFRSTTDIRRLKKEMKDKGLEKEFKALKDRKVEEIFREGGFGAKKMTGTDLQRIIDKDHKVLSELLGEEEVSLLYKVAAKAAQAELTQETVKQVAKAAGKLALNMAGLGKLLKFIPLNSI